MRGMKRMHKRRITLLYAVIETSCTRVKGENTKNKSNHAGRGEHKYQCNTWMKRPRIVNLSHAREIKITMRSDEETQKEIYTFEPSPPLAPHQVGNAVRLLWRRLRQDESKDVCRFPSTPKDELCSLSQMQRLLNSHYNNKYLQHDAHLYAQARKQIVPQLKGLY